MTLQRYFAGDAVWESDGDSAAPVYLAGPYMYYITTVGGQVCAFGAEHLHGKMGGAWAHPLRLLHGWSLALEMGAETTPLEDAPHCDLFASHVTRRFACGPLAVTWTEFVAEDAAALVALVEVTNGGADLWDGALVVSAEIDLRGCWFGGWENAVPQFELGEVLLATAPNGPYLGRGLALGSSPAAVWRIEGAHATARLPISLAPGETRTLAVCAAADHTAPLAAAELARRSVEFAHELLAAKIASYEQLDSEVTLRTPDPALDQSWLVARRNTRALAASYPDLPPYLLAGLPEYPQLFGCDNEYNAPGALAGGFAPLVRSTLAGLAAYGRRACGRIPHEVTTNGRVFNPGNIQETPQFAVACWDYLRWSGDTAFLEQVYPVCVEGLEHFGWTLAGGPYPVGDGVVERLGMGACKLDSVCYLYQGLAALREMALALGRIDEAEQFAGHAERLAARFERDWWLAAEDLYADSLHLDGRPQLDGHWTVVIPLQTGLASEERARRSLARIEAEWVNEWGLVHTRGVDDRVWTLPTGLLALAAFRYGRPELGVRLLRNIGETARRGGLGMLKELIPAGLCFVQLWSAGLYMQGIVEGLLGVSPLAHRHEVTVAPQLPDGWNEVHLRGLPVGEHRLDLRARPDSLEVRHVAGSVPLTVRYAGQQIALEPFEQVTLTS
ncbi:MAG: glycosyl hydrolase family 65 protein [Chloroflexota bacterium]